MIDLAKIFTSHALPDATLPIIQACDPQRKWFHGLPISNQANVLTTTPWRTLLMLSDTFCNL